MKIYENLSLRDMSESIDGRIIFEQWKPIQKWEGYYEVSNFGRVRGILRVIPRKGLNSIQRKPRIISQFTHSPSPYLRVCLKRNAGRTVRSVHRLIAETFLPNPSNKPTVNHKMGDKLDNRSHQLEWATSLEQDTHARKMGLKKSKRGDQCSFTKLRNRDVIEIFNSSEKNVVLSKRFNVCESSICAIKMGRSRSDVTCKKYVGKRRLTNEEILGMYNSRLSLRKTAKIYGVESTTVFKIKKGLRYSSITLSPGGA